MKTLRPFFIVIFAGFFSAANAQLTSLPPSGGNQKSMVKQFIGADAFVEITYSSPDVAGREGKIWGGVVPYGKTNLGFGLSSEKNPSPWRAGANENTTIKLSHDMEVDGSPIKAGEYALFVEPQKDGPWKVIFSSETNAWGSFFYVPEDEVLSVEATPEENDFREYLTYDFTNRKGTETTLNLMWENIKLPINMSLPNAKVITLASIESELKNAAGFSYQNWVTAANWASGAGFHDKAIQWADAAITTPFIGQKNFITLSTKAAVLAGAGKTEESAEVMDQAIKDPSATPLQIHGYGRQLIASGQKDMAMEVFKYNHKRFDGAWPTNYGLARAYSAMGNYKEALKHLKKAQKNIPENDTINPPVIEANIKKLENGEDIN